MHLGYVILTLTVVAYTALIFWVIRMEESNIDDSDNENDINRWG